MIHGATHNPDQDSAWTLRLSSEAGTQALAKTWSTLLSAGHVLLLSGPLGVGKSALARAIIQSLQAPFGAVEDVPSPSFTLVQTYTAGDLMILHADLYRLGDSSELNELGLTPPPDDALCLIEWPERNPDPWPNKSVTVSLEFDQASDEGRVLHLGPRGNALAKRLHDAVGP